MSSKDLHSTAFDEATITKLEIFEKYAQAWIPTFVFSNVKEVSIFDFFAGTGYDISGVPGSPIRILQKIKEQIRNIQERGVVVNVHFNEYEPNIKQQTKYEQLTKACTQYLAENTDLAPHITISITNKDFADNFQECLPIIKKNPSLVYIDQNGLKFLSDDYLLKLEKLKGVDFLYFASSSYLWRFGETDEIKKYLPINLERLKEKKYEFVHGSFTQQLRERLPENSDLKLHPFSIQKGKNIYGIIFGAKHPLAVSKFLEIAWNKNELNGEANFDIHDDTPKPPKPIVQLFIFEPEPEEVKRSKIEIYQDSVKSLILERLITNNKQLLDHALSNGHIGKHASDAVRELKKEGLITYDSATPGVSYNMVFKENKLIEYKIL